MRYFRSVEGMKVNRFGQGGPMANAPLIGAHYDEKTFALTWDLEAVTAISDDECLRYKREYDRLVKDGALVETDEAAWTAWRAARKEKQKEVLAAQKQAAEKPAAAAEAEPAPAPDREAVTRDSPPPRPGTGPARKPPSPP